MATDGKNETPSVESTTTVKSGETIEEVQKPLVNLDTTGKSEIEQRIVARAQGKKPEPPQKAEELAKKVETQEPPKVKEKAEPPAENAPAQAPPLVITDEMVAGIPALKTLVGKPFSELAKAYANLNKEYGRSQTEVATLKQKPAVQETKQPAQGEEKSFKQQVEEMVDKANLPDPIDDQKAYNKALINTVLDAIDKKLEMVNKPILEQFDSQKKVEKIRQQHDEAVSLIKDHLKDETVDYEKLMNDFTEFVKPVTSEYPTYYNGKPELIASDMARFFYSQKAKTASDELATAKAEVEALKVSKQPTAKEMKAKIENAPIDKKNPGVVQKEKDLTPMQEMENKILKRHTGEEVY